MEGQDVEELGVDRPGSPSSTSQLGRKPTTTASAMRERWTGEGATASDGASDAAGADARGCRAATDAAIGAVRRADVASRDAARERRGQEHRERDGPRRTQPGSMIMACPSDDTGATLPRIGAGRRISVDRRHLHRPAGSGRRMGGPGPGPASARRRRSELSTTLTELKAMAAAASTGSRRRPKNG